MESGFISKVQVAHYMYCRGCGDQIQDYFDMLVKYYDKIREDFSKLTTEEREELRDYFNDVAEGFDIGDLLFAEEDIDDALAS